MRILSARFVSLVALAAALLSSCCEPSHRNSQPLLVDSLFSQSNTYDFDYYTTQYYHHTQPDSGWYPIFTFGIKNTGTDDDDFTLKLRYFGAGFDITKRVPAGATVLFKTPIPVPDSITQNARYYFPNLTRSDSVPLMTYAYLGMFQTSPDSATIQSMKPTLSISYGGIDNGPEACNTPASDMVLDISRLGK